MSANKQLDADAIDLQIKRELNSLRVRKCRLTQVLKLRKEVENLERMAMSGGDHKVIIKAIIDEVCESFGLAFSELTSRNRTENICVPRQIVFYLARKSAPVIPLKRIGEVFGKDHGTVIHGLRHIKDRIATDPTFAKRIVELEAAAQVRLNTPPK